MNRQTKLLLLNEFKERMQIDDIIEKSWKFGFSEYMLIFLYLLLSTCCCIFGFLYGANNTIITLSVIYIMGFASFLLHREFEFRDFIKEKTRKKLKDILHQRYKYFYEIDSRVDFSLPTLSYEPTNQIEQT